VIPPLVVIVDDSPTNLKILERLVGSLDARAAARTFPHPDAAIAFCTEHKPDLVVTAAVTCDGDAADFIARLREPSSNADVPVMLIGSDHDLDVIERARGMGVVDHMLVPIERRDFQVRARGLLQREEAAPLADDLASPRNAASRHTAPAPPPHETLSRLIDAIPRMICVTGSDGRYLIVNRAFTTFLGLAASALIGKRPGDAHGGPLARILMEGDERLLGGRAVPATTEEEIVDRNGNPCVLSTAKALFESGDAVMIVTLFIDITARRQIERDLQAAKEQAELANRSKTEFVANMSHELRTPLNAIIGFSQVIAGEMLGPIGTPKYVGYARDVLASAEHLLGLINDILDVSRLEAGKLDLAEEMIDPAKTVADLIHLADAKARASEITVGMRCEGAIPNLIADARKVKQIVLNLLVNALKFSHPGGRVEIVLRNVSGAIAIAVVDHGIGMDADEVKLAMTRFGQVASAWTRKHDGTGLGLPLSIGLTELHGGTLSIRSTKGVGTTVTVTFPRERSQILPTPVGMSARLAGNL
jgi:PAS domain S-box-containing protein